MEALGGTSTDDTQNHSDSAAGSAVGPFNVLVLGGTQFMGRLMVEHLLAGGHRVTISNRGVTANPFGKSAGFILVV